MKHRASASSLGPGLRLTPELCARINRPVADPGPAQGFSYFTDDEYRDSIRAALAGAPSPEDIWIFAYGSLIWKPAFDPLERRLGIVRGWHRSFCLKTMRWRGTPDRPGLMMALEPGGRCQGVIDKLPPEKISASLEALWRREIGVKPVNHDARWVNVDTDMGRVRALTFTANPSGRSYVGKVSLEEAAAMLAEAVGVWGSCAEYLYETVAKLDAFGIRDATLSRLEALVAERILEATDAPPSPTARAATLNVLTTGVERR